MPWLPHVAAADAEVAWKPSTRDKCMHSISCMQGPYSSVAERQSCKLKVLGSIPSEGFYWHVCNVQGVASHPLGSPSWLQSFS